MYVQSAVVIPLHAVYLYVHTTVPLHVTGDGVDVDPIRTGTTVLPQASVIFAGAPGLVARAGQDTVDEPLAGGVNAPLNVTVYVYVQSAVVVPLHAVYLYVHTTVPLHVMGDGVEVDPINTGTTVLPQASVMFAGAPGFVALAGQDTIDEPLAGGVNPPL